MIDENSISKKSSLLTLFLCLVLGQFGAHRFYVGKYITGVIYFLVGGTSVVMDIMGFGYAFVAKIVFALLIIIDTYALYSDSFTDSKGLIISDSEKTLIYDSPVDREKILFLRQSDRQIIFLLAFIFYLSYFLVNRYLL